MSQTELALVTQARSLAAPDHLITDAVRDLIQDGADPLGDAFCDIRSPLHRRAEGQFYTPPEIVGPMVAWVLKAKPTRLVDPGCGSGRYTAAAFRHDSALAIVAVDPDPLAALMTRAVMAVLGATRVRVLCESFLTLRLAEHEGRTAFVGNPPYVRHHALPVAVKEWAAETAKRAGLKISGLAGLHALFFMATTIHAKKGDVGSFVTSAEWLDVGYGSVVRHLLTNGLGGRALDLVDPRAVPFEDAMTTALIACFEVGSSPADVAIQLVDQPDELERLEGGRLVSAAALRDETRWSYHFREDGKGKHEGRTLRDIARVHRGFVSGANAYFILTRERAKQLGIDAWCRPAVTTAAEILRSNGEIRDTPERRVVLDLPADFVRTAHPAVDAYLTKGEQAGLDQRYIPSHRRPWFRIGLAKPAPIIVSYMARQAPRFATNPDGLALLNIGHGVYPNTDMSAVDLRSLVDAMNAMRDQFTGTGRTYHGGLEKFEPKEMESLPVPEEVS